MDSATKPIDKVLVRQGPYSPPQRQSYQMELRIEEQGANQIPAKRMASTVMDPRQNANTERLDYQTF